MSFENNSWRKPTSNDGWRGRPAGRTADRPPFRDTRRRERDSSRGSWGSSQSPIENENEPVAFTKNFYTPQPHIEKMSKNEIEEFRKKATMKVRGENVPAPIREFSDMNFPSEFFEVFQSRNYPMPTPIQAQGWPMAMSGIDMVGIAQTGSGKAISFALPALVHVKAQPRLRSGDGPIALVLTPTRELCVQTAEEIAVFARPLGLSVFSVYGGVPSNPQKDALVRGVDILVATPGRLIELHTLGFARFLRTTFLVIDEADRMLDMGFKPQLEQIIPKTNPNRQTLMWSATWPHEVRTLAQDYTRNAIQVVIGSEELTANSLIKQKIEIVEQHQKRERLVEILRGANGRIIIFCKMKRTCDDLEYSLGRQFSVAAIHGDKTQAVRDRVIMDFKSGTRNILIATDVAARGLDVRDVKLVINYDFPNNCDDYVHRVGRTARGSDKEGFAVTLFTRNDSGNAKELVALLRNVKQHVPEELKRMAELGDSRRVSRFGGSSGFRRW